MNLMIIGNNVHDLALDIWKGNTNFTIVNCTDFKDKYFLNYIKDRNIIIETQKKQFEENYKEVNVFLHFCEVYNFIPIFVSDEKKSFEELMYYNIEEFIPSAILYYAGEDKEKAGWKELVEIAQGYLFNKGIINDKIVRTPKTRKRRSPKT